MMETRNSKIERLMCDVRTNPRGVSVLFGALLLSAFFGAVQVAALDPWLAFAVGMGSSSAGQSDLARGIALDSAGNVHLVGEFGGTVDFDPGPGTANLTSVGGSDVFVLKLDSAGNFLWARAVGGSTIDRGFGIAVDELGNVYATGSFQDTADFDPGAGTFDLTSEGLADIFVQKLDASGNFVWARAMGGMMSEGGLGIAVDGAGNVYTAGLFEDTVDFDPGVGTVNLSAAGGEDAFVHKLNSSGALVWVKAVGSTLDDFASGIALDISGNIYTTGSFHGTVDFDPNAGTVNLTSVGGGDIFVQKLDSAGNLLWARRMGGPNASDDDAGEAIAIGDSGNVHTTGTFFGTADFDPGAGLFDLTSSGFDDIFVQTLDSAGNFVWAKRMGDTANDQGIDIAVDASGNVYTTGYYLFSVDFDPGPVVEILPGGISPTVFVQKLSSAGNLVWAANMGGPFTQEVGRGIAVDAANNPYVAGNFSGTADFDPGPGTFNLTSNGGLDIFVSKFTEPVSLPSSSSWGRIVLVFVLVTGTILVIRRRLREISIRLRIGRGH